MKPASLYICQQYPYDFAYGEDEKAEIASRTHVLAGRQDQDVAHTNPDLLKEVEILFTGWGAPAVDEDFLRKAPKLRAIFHAAGSVKTLVKCDAFWERDICLCNAAVANSVPVAEFCLAQILLAAKRYWFFTQMTSLDRVYPLQKDYVVPGGYRTRIGIITLGTISKLLLKYLKPFDFEVLVFSRSLTAEQAADMGVTPASIGDIFSQCDIVSLHTPSLPSTHHMITGDHFRSMRENATFLNTARGEVVHEAEMIEVARERQDLTFLIDVTDPEPPEQGSPILNTRNIIVSPHIAGSLDRECERMGNMMVGQLRKYLNGEALDYKLTRDSFGKTA